MASGRRRAARVLYALRRRAGYRPASATARSLRLRRERELAFYGDVDFIPTEEYSAADASRAYEEAAWAPGFGRVTRL